MKQIAFWCQLGPLFLLGALAVALIPHYSHEVWLLGVGLIGALLIRKGGKKGWVGFLLLLCAVCGVLAAVGPVSLRLFLFTAAVGVSGWLTWLGLQEATTLLEAQQVKTDTAERISAEWERRWKGERAQGTEREAFCAALQKELTAETQALTEAERQLELFAAAEEHRLVSLHQQLDDKSHALNDARRELFQMESLFFALQKESAEKEIDTAAEALQMSTHMQTLALECQEKEEEVQRLEEWVSQLITQKKRAVRPRKAKQDLEQELSPLFTYAKASESPPQSL